MRKGSANTARGVARFVDEVVAVLNRAGVDTGQLTVRADSGFWSWKLVDRLNAHGARWSITARNIPALHAAISRIPEKAWVLREGTRLEHCPSGHYHANAAWLGCAVLAHNIGIWAHRFGNCADTPVTGRTGPAHRLVRHRIAPAPGV